MVAGIDDISAVAGIISCSLTLLHGCVKGFELLCRARKCEVQMSSLRLMLEFEEQKLLRWAREVGLLTRPPRLRVGIQQTRLVNQTLKHLGDLLCDIQKLRNYGFITEQTSEVIQDINKDSALDRLDLVKQPDVHESMKATTSIFQSRTSPWHRLKWVAVDEQRFRTLLGDISGFNQQLQQLLEGERAEALERRHNILLRTAVMSTDSQEDLDLLSQATHLSVVNNSIAATARLKGRSMRSGLIQRIRSSISFSTGNSSSQRVDARLSPVSRQQSLDDVVPTAGTDETRLLRRLLRLPSAPEPCESRQLAYYNGRPVLVEWRPISAEGWRLLRSRVDKLAGILKSIDDPSFHSLTCHGYLRYELAGLYGYVFDLPPQYPTVEFGASIGMPEKSDLPRLPYMQTLSELLRSSEVKPSLNIRLSCATNLLETILQLHTAGWLHKELRSENIVCLTYMSKFGACVNDLLQNMYIGGYGYARADNSLEFTEPARSEAATEHYRHSASLGTIRMRYQKSFDVFSMGCILLELGLWSDLSSVLEKCLPAEVSSAPNQPPDALFGQFTPPPDETGSDLKQLKRDLLENAGTDPGQDRTIFELLEAEAGRTYATVVVQCLAAVTLANDGNEQITTLNLEQQSLNRLRRLVEVL